MGSGAMGMAFADEILSQSKADRIILVDKHAQPGGHWNDAYPFVSLHQPAAYYGVNSEKLGSGGSELASGQEVMAYYDRVLRKMLETGRVQYFPMCEASEDGNFKSLVQKDLHYEVHVTKKVVDATYMNVQVPSTRDPQYAVGPGVSLIPPNQLPELREPSTEYVVIGAGKTGIDAVLFLLSNQVDPESITWVVPNDAWMLDRDRIQPGSFAKFSPLGQPELIINAQNLNQLFSNIEASDGLFRLDKDVWPTKYRCATVDRNELEQLRRVKNVIRMGRVISLETHEMILSEGRVPTQAEKLYIDCTADGLAKREVRPVFSGNRITLQSLIMCQQVCSASIIGYIEANYQDEKRMNEMAQVVPHPEFSRDYLRATATTMANIETWGREFGLWLRRNRLFMPHHESLFALIKAGLRSRRQTGPLRDNLRALIDQEFPNETAESGNRELTPSS